MLKFDYATLKEFKDLYIAELKSRRQSATWYEQDKIDDDCYYVNRFFMSLLGYLEDKK